MRKIVRCVTEQRLAASSTVTICITVPQASHHAAGALPRARRMVRLQVSTVTLVLRITKANHPSEESETRTASPPCMTATMVEMSDNIRL